MLSALRRASAPCHGAAEYTCGEISRRSVHTSRKQWCSGSGGSCGVWPVALTSVCRKYDDGCVTMAQKALGGNGSWLDERQRTQRSTQQASDAGRRASAQGSAGHKHAGACARKKAARCC
ncbi:MAG: hypothetical protein OXC07_03530 [Kistimonas sp.]|nr:hypothetical protein [Kistimonas sp.]